MYDCGAKKLKLKKIVAIVLACCICCMVLVLPAAADNNIISNNSAKYYAYVYDQLLKYRNGEIDLGTFLGNSYSKYMDTGVDNIGQAFSNIADIVKSLAPFSDDKWNDWYLDNKMGGGGGGGNRDETVLDGFGAVAIVKVYSRTYGLVNTAVYYGDYGIIKKGVFANIYGSKIVRKYTDNYRNADTVTYEYKDVLTLGGLFVNDNFNYAESTFYGDWRLENGEKASEDISELPEKTPPNYDDDSVPEDDLIDFLEDLLNDLQLQFPDLSTIEGLLRAILGKLGTLDSDNDNELLMQILVAIQALKNNGETADNSELLNTLEELKNALVFKDGDKVSSLAELLNTLVQNQVRRSDITIDPKLYNQRYALIEAKLLGKFSFISEIKNFVQYAIDSYSKTDNSPTITIDLFNNQYTIDFSMFDGSINLVRWLVAAFIYMSYAFATFRKIPGYINGGDNQ